MITHAACFLVIFPVIASGISPHPLPVRYPVPAMENTDHVQTYTWPRTSFRCATSSLVLRVVYNRILSDGARALRALTYNIWSVALREVNANACGTTSLDLSC